MPLIARLAIAALLFWHVSPPVVGGIAQYLVKCSGVFSVAITCIVESEQLLFRRINQRGKRCSVDKVTVDIALRGFPP